MRRSLYVILLVCGCCGVVSARQPSSDWQDVRGIPAGSAVKVRTESAKLKCLFVGATEKELNCLVIPHTPWPFPLPLPHDNAQMPLNVTLPRTLIREVRTAATDEQQRRSGTKGGAIAGVVLGTVGGIAAGPPRLVRVLFAAPLLGALGAGIGSLTHPVSDRVVYRAPDQKTKPARKSKRRATVRTSP